MRSVACLLLILSNCIYCNGQSAREIVRSYFEAIGGLEHLRNFKSTSHESIHIQHLPKLDTSEVHVLARHPYAFNFKHLRKGQLTYEAFGNASGQTMFTYLPYRHKMERPKTSVPLTTAHEILEAFDSNKLRRAADTVINGRPSFAIRSNVRKPQLNRTYYFDKGSMLLLGFSVKGVKGNYTAFDNYRKVGNILQPYASRYTVDDQLISEYFIRTFNVNPTLDDISFEPSERITTAKFQLRLNRDIQFLDQEVANLHFDDLLKSFTGKFVLVDLWASWCGPCKHEFSKYDDAFFHFLKMRNIDVVYLSFDKSSKEGDWKKSINDFMLAGNHARAEKRLYQSLKKLFSENGTLYIPRMILVSPSGEILSSQLPNLSSGFFYTKIDELVKPITP